MMKKDYSVKVTSLITNYPAYYESFKAAARFGGPSLYFHNKALSLINADDNERYVEAIYAALVSWGMHRMGSRGAKMSDFQTFYESICSVQELVRESRSFNPCSMTEEHWDILEKIYSAIKVSVGKTDIVAKSKVMAHLMPNIVPPIDREYTLQFLHKNKNINTREGYQWSLMRNILSTFFYPALNNKELSAFLEKRVTLCQHDNVVGWDTSKLKVIDNLIIGAVFLSKSH